MLQFGPGVTIKNKKNKTIQAEGWNCDCIPWVWAVQAFPSECATAALLLVWLGTANFSLFYIKQWVGLNIYGFDNRKIPVVEYFFSMK